ncbi:MAG TPA: hypothetical protein VGP18_13730 [Solirubrobacteraceae bacterium]|nr:hypothetical protein [Solirubrobacteraceae bacterium]
MSKGARGKAVSRKPSIVYSAIVVVSLAMTVLGAVVAVIGVSSGGLFSASIGDAHVKTTSVGLSIMVVGALLDLVPLTGDLSDIQPEEYTRQVVEAMISYAPQLTPTRCEQALISTAVPASYQAGSQWPTGKPTVNLASAFRNVGLGWLVEEGLTNKAVAERRRSGRVPPVVRGY